MTDTNDTKDELAELRARAEQAEKAAAEAQEQLEAKAAELQGARAELELRARIEKAEAAKRSTDAEIAKLSVPAARAVVAPRRRATARARVLVRVPRGAVPLVLRRFALRMGIAEHQPKKAAKPAKENNQ